MPHSSWSLCHNRTMVYLHLYIFSSTFDALIKHNNFIFALCYPMLHSVTEVCNMEYLFNVLPQVTSAQWTGGQKFTSMLTSGHMTLTVGRRGTQLSPQLHESLTTLRAAKILPTHGHAIWLIVQYVDVISITVRYIFFYEYSEYWQHCVERLISMCCCPVEFKRIHLLSMKNTRV